MKKIALISIIALFSINVSAQKYGADSVKCVENLSLYRDYYKQKIYDDAFKFWSIAYKICPASSEKMYVDGTNLMEYKMKKAETKEQKEAYTDSLFMIYDQRIQYFGNECAVLGRKGTDMLRYRSNEPEPLYNTLKKSIDGCEKESEAGAIASFMNATVLMERAEKLTEADVVETFTRLSDLSAYNIAKYEGKRTQEYYKRAQANVESVASSYLSCDVLIEMAEKNFEKNKNDADWMESTANLLDKKNCTDAPIFFSIAKELHETNPSAVSSEKMGIMSLKNQDYKAAETYFKQALEMAQDEGKKADYYIELAQAQSGMGSYSAARANARKAAELKKNYGLPYLMIGDMVAGSASSCANDDACKVKAIYWLAVDYYNKAKSVDPSIADKANGKIATYKKYYPTKEDCFFIGIKEGDTVDIGCWIGESTKARF